MSDEGYAVSKVRELRAQIDECDDRVNAILKRIDEREEVVQERIKRLDEVIAQLNTIDGKIGPLIKQVLNEIDDVREECVVRISRGMERVRDEMWEDLEGSIEDEADRTMLHTMLLAEMLFAANVIDEKTYMEKSQKLDECMRSPDYHVLRRKMAKQSEESRAS